MDTANVRNLDQIQEQERGARPARLGALVLGSLGAASLIVAAVMSARRVEPPARSKQDPLGALIASAKAQSVPPDKVDGRDVTFPDLLSDRPGPTTALAAVKDERGQLVRSEAPGAPALPPASDKLPIVPLPAGTLLGATPVTTDPKDALTQMAVAASRTDDRPELAPAGFEGGYQIQVASFTKLEDADRFVAELRKRGHQAYRQAAHVAGRGLWHRVRIGPFKSRFEAMQYKAKFEKTERVAPFLIDPYKQRQAEEARAARLAAGRRRGAED
jgi:cell division septation protein DedD